MSSDNGNLAASSRCSWSERSAITACSDPYGRTHPTTSLWSSSDIAACHAGTLPFSFSCVFQRIAATAPTPSAPHTTATRSPSQAASSFAGLSASGTSGVIPAMSPRIDVRVSWTSPASEGTSPAASSAPSIAKVR